MSNPLLRDFIVYFLRPHLRRDVYCTEDRVFMAAYAYFGEREDVYRWVVRALHSHTVEQLKEHGPEPTREDTLHACASLLNRVAAQPTYRLNWIEQLIAVFQEHLWASTPAEAIPLPRAAAREASARTTTPSPHHRTSDGESVEASRGVAHRSSSVEQAEPPRASGVGLVRAAEVSPAEADEDAVVTWEMPANFARALRDDMAWIRSGNGLQEASAVPVRELNKLLDVGDLSFLAFSPPQGQKPTGFAPISIPPPDTDYWFLGDLHGDVLAFRAVHRYLLHQQRLTGRRGVLILLGDLVDDGPLAPELMAMVFRRLDTQPRLTAWVKGNHDLGVVWDPESQSFRSSVDPGDFAVALNERSAKNPFVKELGHLFVRLVPQLPGALLVEDGLLVSHAGIPLRDRWEKIQTIEDLEDPIAQQDFSWTRVAENAPRKIPNRASRGSQFGYDDLADFCGHATRVLGRPVKRLVRGHDHVNDVDRFERPAAFSRAQLLTLNGMSHTLKREASTAAVLKLPFERVPCLGRWRAGMLPQIHRIVIPPDLIREVHGDSR